MTSKNRWRLNPKTRGLVGTALSGMDELFHGTAKTAHEIRQEQDRERLQLGNEGDPMKITIKRPNKE